jgi:fibronectin-binding autotransporter adhesin
VKRSFPNFVKIAFSCVLIGGFGTSLYGQNYRTWDDGHATGDWSQKNNWSGNNKPTGSGEVARFSNGNAGTTSIEIDSNQGTGGMLFDANLTVDITFTNAANELSIRNRAGAAYTIVNNSDQTITFENQMGIEKAMSWQTTNLGGGGLVFNEEVDTDGFDLTFHATNAVNFIDVSGNIIDAGGIIKTGAGTLTLAGTNTYSGGTTVSEGILQIGDNGTTGSITGNITNNAALIFNRTNSYTYAGVISGTGTFEQAGSGSTIFTGANIYSGGTTISAGTLQIGNAGTLEIASGGNLTIDGLGGSLSGGDPTGGFTGTLDVDGIMTLNGGLISSGSGAGSTGELILTATNTLEIASNFTFGTVGTTGCGDQLGTLTLQDSTRLVISGGNTVNIGTLNIDGDSVIDFTSAESNTLNLGSLTFTTGSSLVIDGWNS